MKNEEIIKGSGISFEGESEFDKNLILKLIKKARQEGAKSALSLTNAEINIIGKAVAEYWDIHAESPEEDICISAMKKLGFQHVTNDEDSIFYEKELKRNNPPQGTS